jgi:hypothetical protein
VSGNILDVSFVEEPGQFIENSRFVVYVSELWLMKEKYRE